MARSVLIQYDDYFYQEPIILPEAGLKYGSFTFDLPNLETFTPEYIKLYPNPAKELITIEIPVGINAEMLLTDISGKQIFKLEIISEQVVPLRGLDKGIYLVRILDVNNKSIVVKKLIVY